MSSSIYQSKMAAVHVEDITHIREKAPLENLPAEILRLGAESLAENTNPYTDIQHDLITCLLTSQRLKDTAMPLVYRNVKFSKASTFQKFLVQITKYPELGRHVQSLDLSELGTSQAIATADLLQCLNLTPLLRSFLAFPELELSSQVLQTLFCSLPQLQTLNLRSCNSQESASAFESLFANADLAISTSITELNLSNCSGFPENALQRVLSQLPKLQILDVSRTTVDGEALQSIPASARLTHLNVQHCTQLRGRAVARFIASHPSVQSSLVSFNAETKATLEDAVLDEEDVSKLLASIPKTVKMLNLKHSIMTPDHLPLLQALSNQLDELSVGSDLRLEDIESLFLTPTTSAPAVSTAESPSEVRPEAIKASTDPILKSMSQAVAICNIRQRLLSIDVPGTPLWSLKSIDISGMHIFQQRKILTSLLLGDHSLPLTRIAIGEEVYLMCKDLKRVCGAVGWRVEWDGRACEILRD
ncbi:hypothetical protein BP6252_05588 [Coleophoma cylindrospora]|uniref:RNI-like protein n=1 Tax=Coleophoma cylindrospora TaxID=1849047 RepID=A0A3D8RU54_9HELO|nr:hypothetical protein BP6252_05588 [Coleophoma cylindrospora]